MSDRLSELQAQYQSFVEDRDWGQFHTPKNLAEALSIEASELLECFLWHDNLEAAEIKAHEELIAEIEAELADVIIYSLGVAAELDIDIEEAVADKLEANRERFDEDRADEITEQLQSFKR
jgi:NTP pyrophosphatase (non-canonical NTP hydrolase)